MYYFIVNPGSRSGNGRLVWQTVEQELDQAQAEYRVYFTSYRCHATELAKEITSRNERLTLVAVGGDGTVNEVINGIADFSRVTFAYIPTGSSNDFARSLGLPAAPAAAVRNLLHPAYFKKLDLGRLTYGSRKRYFAVSCGCGFDAAICHEALCSRMKDLLNRIKLGKLTYVGIALKQILLFRPFPVTIILDGTHRLKYRRSFFASVMNCCYEGGGLKLCPAAVTDDGSLDICIVERLSKWKIATMLPTAFYGRHTHFKGINIYRARSVEIQSDSVLPVHADGESCGFHQVLSVACVPEKLRVIVGK